MHPNKPIELWDIEKLIPYAGNAKVHSKDQVRKLGVAIQTFGWTQPIIVWTDGTIIAGHGRRLAAYSIGAKKVPVIVRDDLSKAEANALRLADNRVTSIEYDQAAIQAELQQLSVELMGTNIMEAMGFDDKELNFALADLGEINEDFFTDDLAGAVEAQRVENETSVTTTDESAAPIGDALGFKRVTVTQSREIRGFMIKIEAKTGEKGAEALVRFLSENLGAAA